MLKIPKFKWKSELGKIAVQFLAHIYTFRC